MEKRVFRDYCGVTGSLILGLRNVNGCSRTFWKGWDFERLGSRIVREEKVRWRSKVYRIYDCDRTYVSSNKREERHITGKIQKEGKQRIGSHKSSST